MALHGLSRFTDRKVLVTGAASGIGHATALRFLEEGAHVLLVDRDEDKLNDVMTSLDPAKATASLTDISEPKQVEALLTFTQQTFGTLDVLVNNAGVTTMGTALEGDVSAWETV